MDQIAGIALDLEKRIAQDVDAGRAMLGQLLQGGRLMLGPAEDGRHHVLSGLRSEVLFPALAGAENDKPSHHLEGRRPDFVAGAQLPVRTSGNYSGFPSKRSKNVTLEKQDLALLDWLVEKAIETLLDPRRASESRRLT